MWLWTRQAIYNSHTLDLCHTAALNGTILWYRIGEIGYKIESFTKATQGPKEDFTDFLQRLTSAITRMIPNSEARQIIIEPLTFKNGQFSMQKDN